jgi:CHAT domain-containing protein
VIWVFDDRGVISYHTEVSAVELSGAAARFRELCSNPKSDIGLVRKQARSLYEQLIGPIESHLQPDRTLMIELDEGLDGLPMEALLDSQSRYLGERGPLLTSLGILYEPHSKGELRITPDTPALVVVVSAPRLDLGSALVSLPDVVSEGERVAGRFRSATLLTDRQATLVDTLQRIPAAGVFHFAGHASNSYTFPGLLLSDAVLTTAALERQNLAATQLVVLSACDTLDTSVGSGESAEGLVGHFVRAGVPRVVASRWNVDSGSTNRFMNKFYEHLLGGASVEQAIAFAQAALRSEPATAHPSYWAAFAAFGSSPS